LIAETLQAKLTGSEKTALAARPTENAEAYRLYLKGRFFWNKRTGSDLKTAADYFQRAIAIDPGYAAAYAGLAQAELLLPVFGAGRPTDFFPKATVAAKKAIELDETSAEGHAALAMLQLFDFKFKESEEEFKRAIELNPNYATAHHWYGNSLLVTLGRFDEAVAQGKRAIELDPLSLIVNADLGSTLMIARRYDEAIAQLHRTLALDKDFAYAHWNLGEALYLKGDLSGAIAEYEKAAALDDDPEIYALLGRAYADAGQRDKALQLLQKLKAISAHQYVRNYVFTIIYTGLGDKATAIDYLEKAREGSESPDTTWIKVDPLFDPLRNEPRFKALVARIFPPGSDGRRIILESAFSETGGKAINNFAVVVFDLDGTLIDSAPDLTAALNYMLAQLGREQLSQAKVLGMIGRGVRVLVEKGLAATGSATPELLERALAIYVPYYEAHIAVHSRPY
jgi:tetratricopeptide (TPR) repeat protein